MAIDPVLVQVGARCQLGRIGRAKRAGVLSGDAPGEGGRDATDSVPQNDEDTRT